MTWDKTSPPHPAKNKPQYRMCLSPSLRETQPAVKRLAPTAAAVPASPAFQQPCCPAASTLSAAALQLAATGPKPPHPALQGQPTAATAVAVLVSQLLSWLAVAASTPCAAAPQAAATGPTPPQPVPQGRTYSCCGCACASAAELACCCSISTLCCSSTTRGHRPHATTACSGRISLYTCLLPLRASSAALASAADAAEFTCIAAAAAEFTCIAAAAADRAAGCSSFGCFRGLSASAAPTPCCCKPGGGVGKRTPGGCCCCWRSGKPN